MAKKRKSRKSNSASQVASAPMPSCCEPSADAGIRQVQNGFIVRVSSEGLGGKGKNQHYESKTFVAMDHPTALRIASQGFSGLAKKVGSKKGGNKKKISGKRAA